MRAHFVAALFFSLLAGMLPARAGAQAVGPFASAPEVTVLPNGLRVISVPWKSPGIVAYFTLVRVGARDEVEKGHSGFAHLFEHMMFRGTERFPQKVYEERVQDLGADNNAYTTQDFTLYTVTLPASALPQIVELEADRFQRLAYDEQQFRTETGAVLGEYNKSASSPFLRMWEALSELAFRQHTYGHTTIGYLADIQAMPDKMAYSQAFFRRFYTPDNTSIVVAGDVSHAELVKLVSAHYAGWQGERDQPAIPLEPEPSAGAHRHLDWEGTASPRMFIGYRSPAFEGVGTPMERTAALLDTAALEVVHGLLFEPSSPLYQELVVEQQRLLTLSSWAQNWSRDPGLFVVSAELKPEVAFEEVERRVQAALDEVAAGKLPAERVEAVRSHLSYALTMQVETASDAADLLAQFVAITGDTDGLARYLSALKNVTPADVARVVQRYLTPSRRFTVTLAPRKQAQAGGTP
jgi:zinc protease